jgi:tyrosyl-tRNA synthetase
MRGIVADIVDELQWRGLIAQTTDEEALRAAFAAGPVTVYCGFDPTAPSLHLGNLLQILTLRRLQRAGHRPIGLVGGATGLIGDPSGRSAERILNDAEIVEGWVARIRAQIERYLEFADGPTGALVVNNLDWTSGLSAIALLRDIGKHFSVNQMLQKESVSARLQGGGISYTEFSYMILQSMDYLELYRRYGCALQIGGNDQWGNITAGLDLIRRVEGGTAHALTTPLITKADGTKFGKTATGTVWLDPALTSPYAFYQFWINADDQDVANYLRVFSFKPREEIEALEKESVDRPAARMAQRALAEELTTLVHGAEECGRVVAASQALFGRGELSALDDATLGAALAELPHARVGSQIPSVVDLFVQTGLAPSRSAARRAITEGGAYLNNRKVTDENAVPQVSDLLHGRWLVLRRGKRNLAGVEMTE